MSSVQLQPELINEQLTPDEETSTEVKEIIVKSEEKMDDQSILLDFTRIPRIILYRIDHLLDHVCKEEDFSDQQLCKQESDSSLDQKEPEPLQIKEEQQEPEHPWIKEEPSEICIGEQEKQLVLKQETEDAFMVTPFVENCDIKPEPISNQVICQDFNETEEEDQEGNHHNGSGSKQDKRPKQSKTCQKTMRFTDSESLTGKKTETENDLHLGRICSDVFIQKKNLTQHLKNHKEKERFMTDGEHFREKENVTHTDEKPLSQDSNETENQDEEGNHHKDSGSKRGKGPKQSKRRQKTMTITHSESQKGKKAQTQSYFCRICSEVFSQKKNLTQHLKNHKEKERFMTGRKHFIKKKNVTHSMRTNPEKPFCCTICSKAFTSKYSFNYHMRVHTGERPFPCKICKKAFRSKQVLERHMRIHTDEKPFSCTVCDKAFTYQPSLAYHIKVHTGERPFPCNICKKSFRCKQGLERHMRIHTDENPFSCTICGKGYCQKSALNYHMTLHTGERPFSCNGCEKSFRSKRSLDRHTKTHSGEKPFSCAICSDVFIGKRSLINHMTLHTGEKPFSCNGCEKSFRSKRSLKRHMRTHTVAL